jgi:ATP-dependent Lhr-like helicase
VSDASLAFDRLHEGVRRWIWQQGWEDLRDIQERSIPILLGGRSDLVIAAATASGKTEAAFLPIVSKMASDEDADGKGSAAGKGFQAIYVSPMRALINDQFARMEGLCEELQIPVMKWHSDVSASAKQRARKSPSGILLTTPESLEAMLCLRGGECSRLFANLGHVVVDEMHAFIDAPRGRQLQSIMNRIEVVSGRNPVRVGLSATLADMGMAASFLRPHDPLNVEILESRDGGQELRLQVRGYVEPLVASKPKKKSADPDGDAADEEGVAEGEIVKHIFATMRGKRGLIFAGARRRVEMMTSGLRELTDNLGVPEEFFAHHGSLSREHREEAEMRMKDASRPASIVCTTTLELGIDVGHIEAVAQRGAGYTVSGMRQRVGRSGRRKGQAGVMRVYVAETEIGSKTHPVDALRAETVQSIAMLNLMLRKWNEPPLPGKLHLSTLVHQILALITQYGGMSPQKGWQQLADSRVFPKLTMDLYKAVLRRMGHPDVKLLDQAPDGTLLPGEQGERLCTRRDFYAVFMTPEEFRVVTDRGKNLGTIPIDNPVVPEQLIILTGRRWRVLGVNSERREILVTRAYGGKPPNYGGDPGMPAGEVVAEMRRVWMADTLPAFMDPVGAELLIQGRETFRSLGLHESGIRGFGDQVLLFPWAGGRAQNALMLALARYGLKPSLMGLAIAVPAEMADQLWDTLEFLASSPAPDAIELARLVPDKIRAKYDHYLGDELLTMDYAAECIDAARVPVLAAALIEGGGRNRMELDLAV